jgi:inorganic triphosphatase YgiF
MQTLKRGRGFIREEHEAAIDGLAPDPALEPLPSLLPHGADLRPAFNVRVSRRQRTFRYRGALIEMALDQGEVCGGEQTSPICEVELELKSGEPTVLFALARELSGTAPLYLAFDSKAARGQALVAGEPPAAIKGGRVQLDGEASAGAALQAVARSALAQIAANAAVLRKTPSAEGVHQLRVGVRRLRSALTTFRPIVEDEALETLKADLKWLSRSCERARSLDVFADETLQPAEVADVQPAGLVALRNAIELARHAAWAQAAEASASERFRALMIDAAAWVETGDWRGLPGADAPIRPFARRALKRHLKTLEKRGRAARGGDDLARHQLRIEAKKLRYAAEAFADLYGEKRTRRHLRHLRELQEALGALNDLVTAAPLIAALGLPSDAAFAAGELVGMKAARKPQLIVLAARALDRLEAAEPFWT